MKALTKSRLEEAQKYCDDSDKSTEFMIQYMQDFAGVDFNCVMSFLRKQNTNGVNQMSIQSTIENRIENSIELMAIAGRLGADYAIQILDDKINHQDGPGKMGKNDSIPDMDYKFLKSKTLEIAGENDVNQWVEDAYKIGYNNINED